VSTATRLRCWFDVAGVTADQLLRGDGLQDTLQFVTVVDMGAEPILPALDADFMAGRWEAVDRDGNVGLRRTSVSRDLRATVRATLHAGHERRSRRI
jgi:hypothetical protein